tara:strand:+ start:1809 stop:2060 length:252 start_codon:yes stop_codon:yes gene_type:complete
MTKVFAIQFKNNIYDDENDFVDNLGLDYLHNQKNNKILDNKIYLNPEDAILALESILETLSDIEQELIEDGMLEYSVSSYELV